MASISPTQSEIQTALASFLAAVLPGASPPAVFVGTIAGTTLTVTPLPNKVPVGIEGTITANSPLFGLGVAPGTVIIEQLTGSPSGGVGTYEVSISQAVDALPMSTGVTVVAGQQNRVAEPANPYFAVFTLIRSPRFSTNVDSSGDVKFTGSIAANTMTVSAVAFGEIEPSTIVFGTGVTFPTTILNQLTGSPPGGVGTYAVSPSQSVGSRTLSAGSKVLSQDSEFVFQCDFHSPDTLAGDFAKTVSTALRDEFATTFFDALTPPLNTVAPLFADDPTQLGWSNAEGQWETRWSLDIHLEAAQVVSVPAQYSDAVDVTVVSVDATFPPG